MDRASDVLDVLEEDYASDFGLDDQRDSISSGVRRLYSKLSSKSDPSILSDGYRLALRNDLCSFPEFYSDERDDMVCRDSHLIVDTNPIFTRIKKKRRSQGKSPIKSSMHEDMNKAIGFLSYVLPHSPFFRRVNDDLLKDSSRAFFPDRDDYSVFKISDHPSLIEKEIESLTDKEFIGTAFYHDAEASRSSGLYHLSLDSDVTRDVVKETLLTYFARLELNSEINKMICDYSPSMVSKLYDKDIQDADDLEKTVSQLFVAHDWLYELRDAWLSSDERISYVSDEEINVSDYLHGGEQMLLFELIPRQIDCNDDFKTYCNGQAIRMIHEDEFWKEGQYVQDADLGDKLTNLMDNGNMVELKDVAKRARGYLDDFPKKLPFILVKYDSKKDDYSVFRE